MSFLEYFRSNPRPSSASKAKERLQIIVAHEGRNAGGSGPDFLPRLQRELLQVVRKYYVAINQDQVKVNVDREGDYEVLELNIVLPDDD